MKPLKTMLPMVIGSFLMITTSLDVSAQRQELPINRADTVKSVEAAPEESNQTRSDSFEETTNLLENLLETKAKVVFIKDPELKFSPGGLKQYEAEIKKCSVNLNSTEKSNREIIFRFNDVDPASINLKKSSYNHFLSSFEKVVINSYTLSFQSFGMQKSFVYTDDKPPVASGLGEYHGSSLQIAFPRTDDSNVEESETARRFEKALRDAVELCGKK